MNTTARRQQQAEKFARYTVLRDEGAYPADAAREIGLTDGARRAYERAYKRLRGIPRAKSAY
jgi:hypothetical protein